MTHQDIRQKIEKKDLRDRICEIIGIEKGVSGNGEILYEAYPYGKVNEILKLIRKEIRGMKAEEYGQRYNQAIDDILRKLK
jgi:hypothetical protein